MRQSLPDRAVNAQWVVTYRSAEAKTPEEYCPVFFRQGVAVSRPAASHVTRPSYNVKLIALTVRPSSATALAGTSRRTQPPAAGTAPTGYWLAVPYVP